MLCAQHFLRISKVFDGVISVSVIHLCLAHGLCGAREAVSGSCSFSTEGCAHILFKVLMFAYLFDRE
jgi:hypothetical protein